VANIAVIDDSQATIDMVQKMLGQHNVTGYTDVTEVETQLSALRPDAILLDIVMPERDGYQILRALRRVANLKDVPVIVISNKQETTDIEWAKRQGAHDYVPKPFDQDTLNTIINRHL